MIDPLHEDVIDVLREIKAVKDAGRRITEKHHNKLVDAIAEIAITNGMEKDKFFHEANKLLPFVPHHPLNDFKVEAQGQRHSGKEFLYYFEGAIKIVSFLNQGLDLMNHISNIFKN